ncbi:MAG: hypothetical protein V2I82_09495 [Halieaceae bacterium]|jgi:hypothetical protein|nr:hypothetical protein [Halieaceae bacterium]
MSSPNVLVFASGGGRSGKESAAQALLRRCREHPIHERWWLTLVGDAQLRIEHALDLKKSDLAVFIADAASLRDPYRFFPLPHESGHRITSSDSGVTPQDVLHTLSTLGRRDEIPQCYCLELRQTGAESLSADRVADVDSAFGFLLGLLNEPDAAVWNDQLSSR